jgi:hypothetical protein
MNQEAQLTVLLTLRDQLSGGVAKANSALSNLAGGGATLAGRALTGLEGAASHAWGQIKNLAGSLGMIGIGGGLIAITGFLHSAVGETEAFGEAVLQLHKFTGESAESLSALASAMVASGTATETAQKSIGMMNKLIGGMTTKQEIDYEVRYGFALRDTAITATQLATAEATLGNAKATNAQKTAASTLLNTYFNASYKSTNDLVLQAADLYNNDLIPSEEKAAAMAKVFGRSWQTLIPLFEQGSDGIKEVEQQAAEMGMTITTENLPAIEKMHDAGIRWNQAMGGLKLQIGLGLLPVLSDLADAASSFVSGHGAEIKKFFVDLTKTAQGIGKVIQDDVIPIFKMIWDGWNALPGDLKTFLIGGFVASKITGIGITDVIKGLASPVEQKISNALVPQNVFVVNWAMMGGLGGAAGVAGAGGEVAAGGAAAGGAGLLATVMSVALPVAIVAGGSALAGMWLADQQRQEQAAQNQEHLRALSDAGLAEQLVLAQKAQAAGSGLGVFSDMGAKMVADALAEQTRRASLTSSGGTGGNVGQDVYPVAAALQKAAVPAIKETKAAIDKAANQALADAHKQVAGQLDAKKAILDGTKLTMPWVSGTAKSTQFLQHDINVLKGLQQKFNATGDTATAAALGADIATMQSYLGGKLDGIKGNLGGLFGPIWGGGGTGGGTVTPPKVPHGAAPLTVSISARDVTDAQTQRSLYRGRVPI